MADSNAEPGGGNPPLPVTTMIHLHSKTPINLHNDVEPGGEAVMFRGVVKCISDNIVNEYRQYLEEKGFIIVGTEQNTNNHAIFMIGWTSSPPPEFTRSHAPSVLSPLFPLLRAPPDIAHVSFTPSIQCLRHEPGGTDVIFDIVKWTPASAASESSIAASEAAAARFVDSVLASSSSSSHNGHDGAAAAATANGCISAHMGGGVMRGCSPGSGSGSLTGSGCWEGSLNGAGNGSGRGSSSDSNASSSYGSGNGGGGGGGSSGGAVDMRFVLVRWQSCEQAREEGEVQAALNVVRGVLWHQGTIWDTVLCQFNVYYPV